MTARASPVQLRTYGIRGPRSAIVGLGAHVPSRSVSNDELVAMGVCTSDEWIVERTGIRARRIAEPGTPAFALGAKAAAQALEMAGVQADEIDVLVVSTTSPDSPMPSMACRIQNLLGAYGACAYDLLGACSGFLYALSVADAYVACGAAHTVLAVGTEVMSRMIDWKDRHVSVLFADGAGAAIVRPAPPGAGFTSWCLGSDGRGYDKVTVGNVEAGPYATCETAPKIDMKGPEVFRFGIDMFTRQAEAVTAAAGICVSDVDVWVPHQANRRIIEAAARRLAVPLERMVINVDRYGNTCSASIPLALKEAVDDGRIRSGDQVLMVAFGSGLTWASCLHAWP